MSWTIVGVNQRVYTHFGLKAKREALANLDALFGGALTLLDNSDKGQDEGQTDILKQPNSKPL